MTVAYNERRNYEAVLGAGEASLAQRLALPAGTYSAWAWIEIEPGKTRDVTVEASGAGVTAAGYAQSDGAKVVSTISASTAINGTASDQKFGFYHQRVRVTFTTDGSGVTFAVRAADGDAKVLVDDLRVVEYTPADDCDDGGELVGGLTLAYDWRPRRPVFAVDLSPAFQLSIGAGRAGSDLIGA